MSRTVLNTAAGELPAWRLLDQAVLGGETCGGIGIQHSSAPEINKCGIYTYVYIMSIITVFPPVNATL